MISTRLVNNLTEPEMAQDEQYIRLRIPADIKARVTEAARKSRRSMNGEIVFQLEKVFPEPAAGGEQA
jgi:predicted HicB family RNase H-like nuclease